MRIDAIRVDATTVDKAATITITLPRFFPVHIACLDETRFYDIGGLTPDQHIAAYEHGPAQKLTDAGAGKELAAALAAIEKREKTLWADGRASADPVTSQMCKLARKILKAAKVKDADLPNLKTWAKWAAEQDPTELAKIRKTAEADVAEAARKDAELALLGAKIVAVKVAEPTTSEPPKA